MAGVRRLVDRRALFASGAAAALLAASGLAADARPRRGGRLRIAAADAAGLRAVARLAVFDTLTEVAPDGVLRGELATGWEGSADARHWRFDLRGDAVFHGGRAFEPADAIATLRAPGSPVAGMIAGARRAGAAIEIDLTDPDAQFPFRLCDPALAVAPGGAVPARMADWTGTGLYRMARGVDGRHFLGRRVDAHYRDGQAGWLDAVEVIALTDPDVRAEALRDGFVDVAEIGGALQATAAVARPRRVSERARLDDGRIAERWSMA